MVLRYNPLDDDDDDALYDAIKWRKNTTQSIIFSVIPQFVIIPFLYIVLWALSLPRRKYLSVADTEKTDESDSEVENGVEEQMEC